MTIAKIIIFLLTILFLVFAKKRKTDTYFFRNIVIALIMLIAFCALCMIITTSFSCGNILLMIGSVIFICNLGERENIFKYAIPFYEFAIISYVIALFF